MDMARAAQLRALLEGVSLPAEKAELLEQAVRRRTEPALIAALRQIPDRRYQSLDEVGREVIRVESPSGLT
jgi:hypothetical protein